MRAVRMEENEGERHLKSELSAALVETTGEERGNTRCMPGPLPESEPARARHSGAQRHVRRPRRSSICSAADLKPIESVV